MIYKWQNQNANNSLKPHEIMHIFTILKMDRSILCLLHMSEYSLNALLHHHGLFLAN